MEMRTPTDRQALALSQLIAEFRNRATEWTERLAEITTPRQRKGIVCRLLGDLLERIEGPAQAQDELAQRIHQFVTDNLHRGPTLKDLARFLGYSEKYSSDLFRTRMGRSFSQYLKHLRIQRATRLLALPQTTLAEVAEVLGFCDQFAFSHFFKKAVGCSPKQFRERVNVLGKHDQTSDRGGLNADVWT